MKVEAQLVPILGLREGQIKFAIACRQELPVLEDALSFKIITRNTKQGSHFRM